MQNESDGAFVELDRASKLFGGVAALTEASMTIGRGERLAIIGHNGAGKSTLVNLVVGVLGPTDGRIVIKGDDVTSNHSVAGSFASSIRCVFQEMSLCPNLTAYENLGLQHRSLRKAGWRSQARRLMRETLDEIFPGNQINVEQKVSRLSIGERQMVEIARAFVRVTSDIRLVILDEPTSSLDVKTTESLMAYLRTATERGISIVFISHRLREVLDLVERVVVMRDGRIVADQPSHDLGKEDLVALMGGEIADTEADHPVVRDDRLVDGQTRLLIYKTGAQIEFDLFAGEIVGLAGLDGHGQRDLLHAIYLGRRPANATMELSGTLAYVSGDRQNEGVFPLWSVGRNITIGLVDQLRSLGLLWPAAENRVIDQWVQRLEVRTESPSMPILSLSGGNQQKALIARAFASQADVILLDDPTRGVDVNTKKELYERVRAEAKRGRSFIWYTTEFDELEVCDRLYVFYDGAISDHLTYKEISEDRILRASFGEANAHV